MIFRRTDETCSSSWAFSVWVWGFDFKFDFFCGSFYRVERRPDTCWFQKSCTMCYISCRGGGCRRVQRCILESQSNTRSSSGVKRQTVRKFRGPLRPKQYYWYWYDKKRPEQGLYWEGMDISHHYQSSVSGGLSSSFVIHLSFIRHTMT
jgi:hypothetical protein